LTDTAGSRPRRPEPGGTARTRLVGWVGASRRPPPTAALVPTRPPGYAFGGASGATVGGLTAFSGADDAAPTHGPLASTDPPAKAVGGRHGKGLSRALDDRPAASSCGELGARGVGRPDPVLFL